MEFAKERVENFAHIGDAGSLHGDAEAAAAALQLPLDGPAYQPGEIFVAGLKKMRIKTWRGGMQMNQMETPAQELEYVPHSATTVEELEKLVAEKEAEVKALYQAASDMFTVRSTQVQVFIKAPRSRGSPAHLGNALKQ